MPLSNFSAGLAVLAPAAVALLMILVFKDIRINSIIVAIIGTLGGVLMFATAQLSYQKAVSRAKQTYLKTLSDKYENYYQMVLDESNPRKLQEAKEGIGALEVIEKNIKAIPNWLIDLSDTQKIVWSSLAPIGSLFLSQVLKFLGLN